MNLDYILKIGDTIRDFEDRDCYYEGTIVSLRPLKYKINNILWCGEKDVSMNSKVTSARFWYIQVLLNNNWFNIEE